MATDHEHGNGGPTNPSVSYDKTDLGARGILIFFVVLAVFAVAVHVGILGLYAGLIRVTAAHDPEPSPLASKVITAQPGVLSNTANVNVQKFPEPRLQSDDTGDMQRFLQKEAAALAAEAGHDAAGNTHLPIAQAMQQAVAQLPVRAHGVAPEQYPGTDRTVSYPPAQAAPAAAEQSPSAEAATAEPAGKK